MNKSSLRLPAKEKQLRWLGVANEHLCMHNVKNNANSHKKNTPSYIVVERDHVNYKKKQLNVSVKSRN